MYGHPALVTDHARALAPSPRAFNRWFWKDARQGVFPELLLPSPAPGQLQDQAGGSLYVGCCEVHKTDTDSDPLSVSQQEGMASNTTPFSLNLRLLRP